MKKFFKIILGLLIILTITGAVVLRDFKDKQIVILKNGTTITAEETWETGDTVFYENNKEIYFLNKDEIESIGKGHYRYLQREIKNRFPFYVASAKSKIKSLLQMPAITVDPDLSSAIVATATALFCIIIFAAKYLLEGNLKAGENHNKENTIPEDKKQDIPTRVDIVRFFLNLFRLQIGAAPDAPVEFTPLYSKSSGPNTIYKLRVKHHGDWVSRRMTIGPLGDESGSKSKCYYVIFDVHLVVKIPARPIVDFGTYIESIKKERHIVDKLAPKECIIPKVGVILSLIHTLPGNAEVAPEKLEERYMTWLRESPDYQAYLKINNTFVFFMDLSKYYFLSHIIENLHESKKSLHAEIATNPEIIKETNTFKGRYGEENDAIFLEIREVFNQCEAEIRRLLPSSGITTAIAPYQIQGWFVRHLAGQAVTADEHSLPEQFVTELNALFQKLMQQNKKAVEAYRRTIKAYVDKTAFEQNKAPIGAIITNLLELLAWLREKRVALRDLKPDNLFVAGDPGKYPQFLWSAAEFSLGIIDVETAVDFGNSKQKKVKQPLLGGTPYYATPSHFIKNQWLRYAYKNLSQTLHFQDWHAILVMIFRVATGELLFEQTARVFGDVKTILRNANMNTPPQLKVIEEVNRIYWRSARIEFRVKTGDKAPLLKSIEVVLPEAARNMFEKVLKKNRKFTLDAIREYVHSQRLFESDRICAQLLQSSSLKVGQFKNELEKKVNVSKKNRASGSKTSRFLDNLVVLKMQAENQAQILGLLAQPVPCMSAFDLLALMFHCVLNAMYKREWKTVYHEEVEASDRQDDAVSLATTI
ncbi:MAG: hypothetical protein JSW39_10660 [Desulfobacterales bacterium]|nr:MAG: hypothetical protein JSW39_10660 [Desulfobacterales bacterium]